jgi:hypothetical protein
VGRTLLVAASRGGLEGADGAGVGAFPAWVHKPALRGSGDEVVAELQLSVHRYEPAGREFRSWCPPFDLVRIERALAVLASERTVVAE